MGRKRYFIFAVILVLVLSMGKSTQAAEKKPYILQEQVTIWREESVPKEMNNSLSSKKGEDEETIWTDEQGLCYKTRMEEDGDGGYVLHDNQLTVSAGKLKKKKIVIPDTFQGKKVVAIEKNGFSDCDKLTSITLGKNIWHIQDMAFYGCENLSKIKIKGKSLNYIGSYVFDGECKALKELKLPKTLGHLGIGDSAFAYSYIENIVLPNELNTLSDRAFEGCKKLKKVVLGKETEEIGENCFEDCTSLEKVIITKKVEKINEEAFLNCKRLKKIVFKGNTYDISEEAFAGTPYEKAHRNKGKYYIVNGIILETYGKIQGNLTIDGKKKIAGQRIKGISGNAYSGDKNIKNITLKNLKGITGNTFVGVRAETCTLKNIDTITYYPFYDAKVSMLNVIKVKHLKEAFEGIEVKKQCIYRKVGHWDAANVPKGMTKLIVDGVEKTSAVMDFPYRESLKEAILKGDFSRVFHGYAEGCTSLEKLTIQSTKELEWYHEGIAAYDKWFEGCSNLKDVYLETPNVNDTVKGVFPDYITLHVPAEQVVKYQKYVTCNVVAW